MTSTLERYQRTAPLYDMQPASLCGSLRPPGLTVPG
jgi:hypothetical protein